MLKFIFLILLYSLNNFTVSAQNGPLVFRNITRSSGLPVDEVTSIVQDSTGFIWIGTLEGIFRYDGFVFKSFSFDGSRHEIGSGISKIIVDRKGRLWIASIDGGLSCINRTGKVLKVINSSTCKLIPEGGNYVTDVAEDNNGNIWWTTTDGLYCLKDKDNSIDCYKLNTSERRGNAFNYVVFDSKGQAWVGGILGLKIFNIQTKQFEPAGETPAERNFFANKKDFAALAFQQDKIWYSNWAPELGSFNRKDFRSEILYSGSKTVQRDYNRMANTFFIDSKNGAWIGTGRGLHLSKADDTSRVQTFSHTPQNNFSLVNNWVNEIMEDREGNIWVATKKGISVVRPYTPSIVNISSASNSDFPFADKEISFIINADSNNLLVGTHTGNGVYLTDLKFRTKKHWNYNNVAYDWVWRHFDDKKRQRIFISTQEGMLLYDKRTQELEKATDTVFRNFYPVSSFVATSDSIVWMSRFWNKIMRYNLATGEHKIFDITRMGEKPQVLYLSKDSSNRLWIRAHHSGLWRFDYQTEKIVERLEKSEDKPSIREHSIFSFIDLGEHYLIGYFSKGISLYHKKNKTFRHITKENGLVSNSVQDAIMAKDGTVWIATKNGLSNYDPRTGIFKNYNYESGIIHNDFMRVSQLKDGRIAAGTTLGVVCFHPHELDKRSGIAPPMITEMNIHGKSVPLQTTFTKQNPVSIPYGNNYFSFEYISLHYASPQQVEYAYKLEGLDKDWIAAGPRKFASYSHIPGGNYTFRVKARLHNSDWVEDSYKLPVFVQTAFYRQWWFYILCVLAVGALVYGLFRYFLHQALKVERMRTAISSDLHDEVGASLTSISLFSEMARLSTLPQGKKEEYLMRIGERSRDSIEKMSDIIWSINPENDNLQQMLVRMKNYAVEVTEARDIRLQWLQSGSFAQSKLSMQQRKNLYLFFKEAINNAVKHACPRHINLQLKADTQQINMLITDDGKGFNKEQPFQGNGLKSMQRRADQLNGTLRIESSTGKGTSVQLLFNY
ncbi:MAG TPA: two-component regulator propeller domain-containing protein [Chitinophagaceae bacterium]